jgi:ankyrin repeat protein
MKLAQGLRIGALIGITLCLSAASSDTRLIDAVERGDKSAVAALLKQKTDVNAAQPNGTTALLWASQKGDAETAGLLIQAGASVNVANRYGVTPLLAASESAGGPITALLLKAGANPDAAGAEGQTPLLNASRAGNLDAAQALIAAGANVNARENARGQTALMWAAAGGHAELVKLLLAHGADSKVRDRVDTIRSDYPVAIGAAGAHARIPLGGVTAILLAARQGDRASVQALLDAQANIHDQVTSDGGSVLLMAILSTHYDLAAYLLDRGADPNQPDLAGVTPLFALADMHKPDITARPLRKEIDHTTNLELIKILLAHKANPNARLTRPDSGMGPGNTPFLRAAKSGDLEVMRVLVEGGANPKLTAGDQGSAIHMAAGGGQAAQFGTVQLTEPEAIEAIEFCLDKGLDVNAVNTRGDTPLHAAANKGWDSVVKFLAGHGAKLDTKNRQGFTPLDIAEGRGGRGGLVPRKESTAALLQELMSNASALK